jgi:glutathione S-transferase
MILITAFRWVPPFAQGLVRDLRARWALEEAGLAYEAKLLGVGEQGEDANRALQPFGQVPIYEEDGLVLFETGAIVLHIAERSETLMPSEPAGRATTTQWVLAALNSIEPALQGLTEIDLFHANEEWARLRRPGALAFAESRLSGLAERLGDRAYLEDRFTAGDLMMTTVLRIPRQCDLLARFPNLDAYRRRCEARPAFQKALADQMAPFKENEPAAA